MAITYKRPLFIYVLLFAQPFVKKKCSTHSVIVASLSHHIVRQILIKRVGLFFHSIIHEMSLNVP